MEDIRSSDSDDVAVLSVLSHDNDDATVASNSRDPMNTPKPLCGIKSRARVAPFVDSEDSEGSANCSHGSELIFKIKDKLIGPKSAYARSAVKKTVSKKAGSLRTATKNRISHLTRASKDIDNGYQSDDSTLPTATVDRSDPPSLFIPEGGDPVIILHSEKSLRYLDSSLKSIQYNMDSLKRARATKAEIENNISVLQPQDMKTSTRRHVAEDPENILIKTLRQDQSMSWSDIAKVLNQERRNRGEAANFTDAAVYGRFVRNAPRIATAVGEIGFDPKDYMHLRNPNQYTQGDGTGTIAKAGKKRIKNYENATELKANIRQQLEMAGHAELETAEKTEQLVEAVAKVERNFWILVADEMERATTKMYEPNALASRYHAI